MKAEGKRRNDEGGTKDSLAPGPPGRASLGRRMNGERAQHALANRMIAQSVPIPFPHRGFTAPRLLLTRAEEFLGRA